MKSKFNKLYELIINDNKAFNCIYEQVIYNNESILPLSEEQLLEALKYIEYFKDTDNEDNNLIKETDNSTQKYFVQLPEQLEIVVEENRNQCIKDEVITAVFPELQFISNKPHIFCGIFSFSDDVSRNTFLNSIARIKNNNINRAFKFALNKNINGICMDLRNVDPKLNLIFLLFNEDNYTRRTIYHEFTHYLQHVVGEKYLTILNANIKRTKIIANKLARFNMTLDGVQKVYFSDKEYVTNVDNLIYMIKEVWKARRDKYLTKLELLNKFISEFSTDDPNILNSKFALEIINVHKTFRNNILFFIFAYICFNKSLFLDLKNELIEKFR